MTRFLSKSFVAALLAGCALAASCGNDGAGANQTDTTFYIINEPVSMLYYWGPAKPTVMALGVSLYPEPTASVPAEEPTYGEGENGEEVILYVDEEGNSLIPTYGGYQYTWEKYIPDASLGLGAPDEYSIGFYLDEDPAYEEYKYAHSPALYPALDMASPVAYYRVVVTRLPVQDASGKVVAPSLTKTSRWAYIGVTSVLIKAVFVEGNETLRYFPASSDSTDMSYDENTEIGQPLKDLLNTQFFSYAPGRLDVGAADYTGLPGALVRLIVEGEGSDSVILKSGVKDLDVVLSSVSITKSDGSAPPLGMELLDTSESPLFEAAVAAYPKDSSGNARDPETSMNLYLLGENFLDAGATNQTQTVTGDGQGYAAINVPGVVDLVKTSPTYQKWTQFSRLSIKGGGGTLVARGGSLVDRTGAYHGAGIGGNGGNYMLDLASGGVHNRYRLAGEIIIGENSVVNALGGVSAELSPYKASLGGPTAGIGGGSWYDPNHVNATDAAYDYGATIGGVKVITIEDESLVKAAATSGNPLCCVGIGAGLGHDGSMDITIGGQAQVIAAGNGTYGAGIGLCLLQEAFGSKVPFGVAYSNPAYSITIEGDAVVYAQGSSDDYYNDTNWGIGLTYGTLAGSPDWGGGSLRVRDRALVAATGIVLNRTQIIPDTVINTINGQNLHPAVDSTCFLLTCENNVKVWPANAATQGAGGISITGPINGPIIKKAFKMSYTTGRGEGSYFMGPDSQNRVTLIFGNIPRQGYLTADTSTDPIRGVVKIASDVVWGTSAQEALAYQTKLDALFQSFFDAASWSTAVQSF